MGTELNLVSGAPYPPSPRIRFLLDGHSCVRDYLVDRASGRWHLFDRDGTRLGHGDMDPSSTIDDRWLHRILPVTQDSLGVASAGRFDVSSG